MAEEQDLTASEHNFYTQYVLMDICTTNATSTRILKHATLQEFNKCKMEEESRYTFQVLVNLNQFVYHQVCLHYGYSITHNYHLWKIKGRVFLGEVFKNILGGHVPPRF